MKRNQTKIYETKRNFTDDETKRNETKFRCFSCFAKQAKFRETIFCFAMFRVSRNKKGCEMETLGISNFTLWNLYARRGSARAPCPVSSKLIYAYFPSVVYLLAYKWQLK
jgi:hypothetical protein